MSKILLLAVFLLLPGCGPYTFSLTIGDEQARLAETEVDRDKDASGAKIALIDLRGTIGEDPTGGLLGSGPGVVDSVVAQLNRAEMDSAVKAVVLRVNSPGGTVTASDILYREIRRFRERSRKPVIVSMSEIAASGGYYISLAADRVVAEPSTLTGSIGVIIPTVSVHEGLARIGIRTRNITSGPNKAMVDPFSPASESHDALVQRIVDEFYASFRSLVVEHREHASRPLALARLDELTDGRILTGRQAFEAGLIDELGGLREAFAAAKSLAKIPSAKLIKYHREGTTVRTPWSAAAETSIEPGQSSARAGSQFNIVNIDADLIRSRPNAAYYLWTGW